MSFSETYRSLSHCKVNMGAGIQFYFGKILGILGVLSTAFPQLFSFGAKENVSVAKFLTQTAHQNFQTPISLVASEQLQLLADLVQASNARQDENDCWTYIWGSQYTSKKAYEVHRGTFPVSPVFK